MDYSLMLLIIELFSKDKTFYIILAPDTKVMSNGFCIILLIQLRFKIANFQHFFSFKISEFGNWFGMLMSLCISRYTSDLQNL